jgi:hypothetical protein
MLASLAIALLTLLVPQQGSRGSNSELRANLGALVLREATASELEQGLARIAREGTLADVELAVMIAARFPQEIDELGTPSSACPRLLTASLRDVFRRHAVKLPRVATVVGERSEPWVGALIAAYGDSATPQAVSRLGEWLASGPDDLSAAVLALTAAARAQSGPFDERARANVRILLDRPGRAGYREAVLALGWLEDEAAVEELCDLLQSGHRGIADDARWSLERITGVRLGRDALAWRRWLAEERDWRLERLPGLLDQVHDVSRDSVALALNEIARHQFPRHELSARLSERLGALDGDLLGCACGTLAQLRSTAAIPALRELLQQGRPEAEHAELEATLAVLEPMPRDSRN